MKTNCIVLVSTLVLSACASSPDPGLSDDLRDIVQTNLRAHARAVREHVRADRQALRAAFSRLAGEQRLVIARTGAESKVAALASESGVEPLPPLQDTSPDRHGETADTAMERLQLEIGLSEMLTPEGTLHPRAAQALTRMDDMARTHGGDFSVAVPRSQRDTAAAIKAVAPGATILEAEDDDHFRLIVVPGGP